MNRLEIAFINVFSPYKVWNRGEVLYFETDKGCRYAIDFEIEEHPLFQAYWFNLTNLDHIASPNDINWDVQRDEALEKRCLVKEISPSRRTDSSLLTDCESEAFGLGVCINWTERKS